MKVCIQAASSLPMKKIRQGKGGSARLQAEELKE
jgi:hypothetical protein